MSPPADERSTGRTVGAPYSAGGGRIPPRVSLPEPAAAHSVARVKIIRQTGCALCRSV